MKIVNKSKVIRNWLWKKPKLVVGVILYEKKNDVFKSLYFVQSILLEEGNLQSIHLMPC